MKFDAIYRFAGNRNDPNLLVKYLGKKIIGLFSYFIIFFFEIASELRF